MIRYKGYIGVMAVDPDANLIHGDVVGLRDVITFQGRTVAEARQAFEDSVDDYLNWCAELGRQPEKPFNGKIMLRVAPAIHRSLSLLAESRSTSINSLAVEALEQLTRKFDSEIPKGEIEPRPASSKEKARRNTRSSGATKTGAGARKETQRRLKPGRD
jgi:predicted HicB family RNase H-like nuclease